MNIIKENISIHKKLITCGLFIFLNCLDIISAAGGQKSALEAIKVDIKTVENGAFTCSTLECLKQNQSKELKVNTLKQYAEKRVEEITNGQQKTTSCKETIKVDWVLSYQ